MHTTRSPRIGRHAVAHSTVAHITVTLVLGVALAALPLRATTITVTAKADTATAGDGACTLREAIANANANEDLTGGDCLAGRSLPTVDQIAFRLGGSAPFRIIVRTPLPVIEESLWIDGLTQPARNGPEADCRQGPLLVLIEGRIPRRGPGDGVGEGTDGLHVRGPDSGGSLVRGLTVGGFGGAAVHLENSPDNVVQCNFLGTDTAGFEPLPNQYGVRVSSGSVRNVIGTDGDGENDAAEGNLVAGNVVDDGDPATTDDGDGFGIDVTGAGTQQTRIAGNRIGTDVSGRSPLGNVVGVVVRSRALDTLIGTDGDGLADIVEANVIAANEDAGVRIAEAADHTTVAGNFVGLDITGRATLDNGGYGVVVSGRATRTVIGTDGNGAGDAAEGNVISGHVHVDEDKGERASGILIESSGVWVAGNRIGTDADGEGSLANLAGITVDFDGARAVLIGTNGDGISDELETNLISGNRLGGQGAGVRVASALAVRISGNFVGTDLTGTRGIGNDRGIEVLEASNVVIGSNSDGVSDEREGNLISGNSVGIAYDSSGIFEGNLVSGNLLGADVSGTAPLPNNTGIRLLSGSRVAIADNRILNSRSTGVVVRTRAEITGSPRASEGNCLAGNARGLMSTVADGTAFESNWWGDPTGPADAGPGSGDPVSDGVDYEPFLTTAVVDCPASSGRRPVVLERRYLDPRVSAGEGVRLRYYLRNPSTESVASDITFTDDVDANLKELAIEERAPGELAAGKCGELLSVDDAGRLVFRGGVLRPREQCSFQVILRLSLVAPSGVVPTADVRVAATLDGMTLTSTASHDAFEVVEDSFLEVDTTDDNEVEGDGLCTLREAINNANENEDETEGDCESGRPLPSIDVIVFSINGPGPHRITMQESPPAITEAVVIDGLTQPAFGGPEADCLRGPLLIELRGTRTANRGIKIDGPRASRSLIRGLAIGGFANGAGVDIDESNDNRVQCVFSGTDASGTVGVSNRYGVRVREGSMGNVVGVDGDGVNDRYEGNLLSGNANIDAGHGMNLDRGAAYNRVAGNFIGTDISGRVALPNDIGVRLRRGAHDNVVGTDGDGRSDSFEGNLISGHMIEVRSQGYGMFITDEGTDRNRIAGNFIGANSTGVEPLPNKVGIRIADGPKATIVGTNGDGVADELEGNLISGNTEEEGYGLRLSDPGTDETWIAGNFIGTDVNGSASLPNNIGMLIQRGVSHTLVGTNADGLSDELEANVISGNTTQLGYGIYIVDATTAETRIMGNLIGTDALGTTGVGNNVGVRLTDEARGVIVGTDGDGVADELEGNVIAGQLTGKARGVFISGNGTGGHKIAGNLIGLDITGTRAIPNEAGIYLSGGSDENVIGSDGDGVADELEGNVISGNLAGPGRGVMIVGANRNRVAGNLIGPSVEGKLVGDAESYGNRVGIRLRSAVNNHIVGNVIAGNRREVGTSEGIEVSNPETTGNLIEGNVIGDAERSDDVDLGNGTGVLLNEGASVLVRGNMVASNARDGINLRSGATFVEGSAGNCVEHNRNGVENDGNVETHFTDNWWGAASGPAGEGPGDGDEVSNDVIYAPFLTRPPTDCGEAARQLVPGS